MFTERGKEGERKGEKRLSIASRTCPAEDLVRNPGWCPDQESNR